MRPAAVGKPDEADEADEASGGGEEGSEGEGGLGAPARRGRKAAHEESGPACDKDSGENDAHCVSVCCWKERESGPRAGFLRGAIGSAGEASASVRVVSESCTQCRGDAALSSGGGRGERGRKRVEEALMTGVGDGGGWKGGGSGRGARRLSSPS